MTQSRIIILSLLSLVGLHAEAQPARSPAQAPPSALRPGTQTLDRGTPLHLG